MDQLSTGQRNAPKKKYNKPFYTDDDNVRNVMRQLMMKCDDEMNIVHKLLHKYQRKPIVVSNLNKYQNKVNVSKIIC